MLGILGISKYVIWGSVLATQQPQILVQFQSKISVLFLIIGSEECLLPCDILATNFLQCSSEGKKDPKSSQSMVEEHSGWYWHKVFVREENMKNKRKVSAVLL